MKKLLLVLAVFAASMVHAQTNQYTPNLGLTLPPHGAPNWDVYANGNFSKLDTVIGALQVPYQGSWISTTSYAKGQQVTYLGVLYASLIPFNLNAVPSAAPTAWAAMVASGGGGGSTISTGIPKFTNSVIGTAIPGTDYVVPSALSAVATSGSYTSLSNLPTLAQTIAIAAHQFLGSYNASTGAFTQAQPAFTDLTGAATPAQLPAATGSNIGAVKPDSSTILVAGGTISVGTVPGSSISGTVASATTAGTVSGSVAGAQVTGNISGNAASITGSITGSQVSSAVASATSATELNGVAIPTSKTIVGTDGSGHVVDSTGATLSNNTTGTASNITGNLATSQLAGSLQAAQEPAHVGDMTNPAGSLTTSVVRVNGAALPTSKAIVGTNSVGQVVDASTTTLSNNTTGNASTATALQVAPTGCTITGQYPTGISATGNATGCSTPPVGATLPSAGIVNATSPTTSTAATSPQIVSALNASPSTTLAPTLLPVATTGAFGAVKPDGTTVTISGGVISAASSGATLPSSGIVNATSPTTSTAATSPQIVSALNATPSTTLNNALLPTAIVQPSIASQSIPASDGAAYTVDFTGGSDTSTQVAATLSALTPAGITPKVHYECGTIHITQAQSLANVASQTVGGDGLCTKFDIGPDFSSSATYVFGVSSTTNNATIQPGLVDLQIQFHQPPDFVTTASSAVSAMATSIPLTDCTGIIAGPPNGSGQPTGSYIVDATNISYLSNMQSNPTTLGSTNVLTRTGSGSGACTITISNPVLTGFTTDSLHFYAPLAVTQTLGTAALTPGAGIIQYPCAVSPGAAQSLYLRHLQVTAAWNSFCLSGQSYDADDIAESSFNVGWNQGGSANSSFLGFLTHWDYGMGKGCAEATTNPQNCDVNYGNPAMRELYFSGIPTAFSIGRNDEGAIGVIHSYATKGTLTNLSSYHSAQNIIMDGSYADLTIVANTGPSFEIQHFKTSKGASPDTNPAVTTAGNVRFDDFRGDFKNTQAPVEGVLSTGGNAVIHGWVQTYPGATVFKGTSGYLDLGDTQIQLNGSCSAVTNGMVWWNGGIFRWPTGGFTNNCPGVLGINATGASDNAGDWVTPTLNGYTFTPPGNGNVGFYGGSGLSPDTGTANNYVATAPLISTLSTNTVVRVMIAHSSTASSMLNVNGLGNTLIEVKTATGLTTVTNQLVAGQIATFEYDGTVWETSGTSSSAISGGTQYAVPTYGSGGTSIAPSNLKDTGTLITAGLLTDPVVACEVNGVWDASCPTGNGTYISGTIQTGSGAPAYPACSAGLYSDGNYYITGVTIPAGTSPVPAPGGSANQWQQVFVTGSFVPRQFDCVQAAMKEAHRLTGVPQRMHMPTGTINSTTGIVQLPVALGPIDSYVGDGNDNTILSISTPGLSVAAVYVGDCPGTTFCGTHTISDFQVLGQSRVPGCYWDYGSNQRGAARNMHCKGMTSTSTSDWVIFGDESNPAGTYTFWDQSVVDNIYTEGAGNTNYASFSIPTPSAGGSIDGTYTPLGTGGTNAYKLTPTAANIYVTGFGAGSQPCVTPGTITLNGTTGTSPNIAITSFTIAGSLNCNTVIPTAAVTVVVPDMPQAAHGIKFWHFQDSYASHLSASSIGTSCSMYINSANNHFRYLHAFSNYCNYDFEGNGSNTIVDGVDVDTAQVFAIVNGPVSISGWQPYWGGSQASQFPNSIGFLFGANAGGTTLESSHVWSGTGATNFAQFVRSGTATSAGGTGTSAVGAFDLLGNGNGAPPSGLILNQDGAERLDTLFANTSIQTAGGKINASGSFTGLSASLSGGLTVNSGGSQPWTFPTSGNIVANGLNLTTGTGNISANTETLITSLGVQGPITGANVHACSSCTGGGTGNIIVDGNSTFAGTLIDSYSGATSAPQELFNGSIFSGGSGTGTFPAHFHQPTGTTAVTNWNTGGTVYGANLPAGWTGNFLDFRVNGAAATSFSASAAGTTTTAILAGTLYSAAGTPLPTCAVGIKGERTVVSDATSPTYMGAYTSGGAITAEVICSYNGTTYSWLTH